MDVPLPLTPDLAEAPALYRALHALQARVRVGEPADLPAVEGVSAPVMARWLVRTWLESGPHWRPLVHLDLRFLPEDPSVLREVLGQAERGWLFLDHGWRAAGGEAVLRAAAGRPIQILRASEEPPLVVPEGLVQRLLYLDTYHGVATDPALDALRRSLLSHARSCAAVHLSGPSGSGKTSLVFWAHAHLDARPISHLHRGGDRRPTAGQWELYEELGELEPDQRYHLGLRLASERRALPPPPLGDTAERPDQPAFRAILGRSAALARVLNAASRVAPSALSVLILGEPGVGKESLAQAIHAASGRVGPCLATDLGALNEELAESELFGHKKGAFTGADRDRPGAFRSAEGGTLFLDEVGNLSPRLQARLLRVLQERVVQPVGDDRRYTVDVRIIAATNADLEGMASRGEFREDLLRRLDAVTLRLPPLRERADDILPLAAHYLRQARGVSRIAEPWITPEAREILLSYPWPGNVRELANTLGRAAVESGGAPVDGVHLGPLSPEHRRPTPLFTTSSDGGIDRGETWGLGRAVAQRLCAVTLRVPALRDRGPLSVRSAVLGMLEGRPIRSDALHALERRPWWGDLPELAAAMDALRVNVTGPVDLGALQRHLPHLLRAGSQPIRVLLHPVAQASGAITGLQEEFHEGALIVGRVRTATELEQVLAGRAEAGRTLLGGITPAFLCLPHLPRLSRAHLLVTHGDAGLVVSALPGARLLVSAGPLSRDGTALQPLAAGQGTSVGLAGEVLVRESDASPAYLHLFLFAGAVAFDEHARTAAERAARAAPTSAQTVLGETVAPRTPLPPVQPPLHPRRLSVWTLNPGERALLNGLVLRFDGVDFAAHLEAGLTAPEARTHGDRLRAYLLGVRPTQYCSRLYEHETNAALRAELAAALAVHPDGTARLARLPLGIQRVLGVGD